MTTSWGQGFPWERAGLGPDVVAVAPQWGRPQRHHTVHHHVVCSTSWDVSATKHHVEDRNTGTNVRQTQRGSPQGGVNGADRMHGPAEDGRLRGCRCRAAYETGATPGAPALLSKAVPSHPRNSDLRVGR